jgi:SPP1 family predicted phage head-tail adaptor
MAQRLRVGKLNKRVTLQRIAAVSPPQYGSGEPDVAWEDVVSGGLYAMVDPVAAAKKEYIAADQLQGDSDVVITIRYLDGIDRTMRVLFRDKKYNINTIVDPEEEQEFLELYCSEGVNDG